jgi:hypothetical protein
VLGILFVLSGCAALVYEMLVWSFMGGMAGC